MEHNTRVSIIAPGLGEQSTGVSLHITRQNLANLLEKGEMDLSQLWSDLDPYFTGRDLELMLIIWSEGLATGPCQENNSASSENGTCNQ